MGSLEKMKAFNNQRMEKPTGLCLKKISDKRLSDLFDPGSFVCLYSTVVSRPFSDSFDRAPVEGDGVSVGYGTINGRLVFAASQDPDVYGGSMGRAHALKIARVIESAIDSNAPFIALYQSGGARIEEGVRALEGLGAVLSALSEAKGRIPILCAIMGACPGGLAVAAAKSDFIFMIRPTSALFMNSPTLSGSMDSNLSLSEKIGSAQMHTRTGLASFIVDSEEECFLKMKELLEFLPVIHPTGPSAFRAALVSDDANRTSDILDQMAMEADTRPLIASSIFEEIADDHRVLWIASQSGEDLVVGLARMDGIVVGFMGNDNIRISPLGIRKAAKFVRFCDAFLIPIVTLTNAEGFRLGVDTEQSTAIEDAAILVDAFANADVPRVAILAGQAIGTAYLCMNSKMLGADMVFAWPTAEISVLSSDAAAHILYRAKIAGSKDPIAERQRIVEQYKDDVADAKVAASLGQVDERIAPSATRPRVISALDILLCAYPLSEA